jgi:hypothetical protein
MAIVDAKELAGNITINIKVTRYNQWQFRYNLGLWLIQLAAWIMWINIEVEEINV